jgi:uncharacterized protein
VQETDNAKTGAAGMVGRLKTGLMAGFWAALVALSALMGLPMSASAEPALWAVKDRDTTIYLFGTVHVLKPDIEWRSAKIDQAFDSAQIVYFETDTDGSEAEMLRLLTELGLNPPGTKLSSYLTPDQTALLKDVAEELGVPWAGLEVMRPWLVSLNLAIAYIVGEGYDPESGVESVLLPEARAKGKDVRFFETVEEQFRFFADLPMDIQVDYLVVGLDEIETVDGLLDKMDAAWVSGDAEGLAAILIASQSEDAPEVYDVLIRNRNANWADAIEGLLKDEIGVVFIAVGAGHLVGPDSVQVMLEARGIEVVRQ